MERPTDPTPNIAELRHQMAQSEARLADQEMELSASGATTPHAEAQGERSVRVHGNNSGTISTATHFSTTTHFVRNYFAAGTTTLTKEEISQKIENYLAWLRSRTENIDLRGLESSDGMGPHAVGLPLATTYVPLVARSRRWQWSGNVQLDEVLGLGNHLAIIGGPGSGKTTVLAHMAWALASSLLTGNSEIARTRLGLTLPSAELPLPILVSLASFARYRRNLTSDAPAQERTLAYFISYYLTTKEAAFGLPPDFFHQLLRDTRIKAELPEGRRAAELLDAEGRALKDDRAERLRARTQSQRGENAQNPGGTPEEQLHNERFVILLLDGLDEVANEDERAEVRQCVEELISGREALRVVVTCRTIAYRAARTGLPGFEEVLVQPLDPELHIAPMIRKAYACIYRGDGKLASERSDNLVWAIRRLEEERQRRLGEQAEPLVSSPLMVRLLLIVHFRNRTLPDERADLFDQAINALLQVDYGREARDVTELKADWKVFREMAQRLAFHMHHHGEDQGREIEEFALTRELQTLPGFQQHIETFISHARHRGSLLEERNGIYRFIHLALQEFLVARYLYEVVAAESQEHMLAFLNSQVQDPWWREPILLVLGYTMTRRAGSAKALLETLLRSGTTADARFTAAEIATSGALEWRRDARPVKLECARRVAQLLQDSEALLNSAVATRHRAIEKLCLLGDPRFHPQHFYLPAGSQLGFVHVAADPHFKIGTRTNHVFSSRYNIADFETNDALTPSPEFYIGRFPVTVGQFSAFVADAGAKLGIADPNTSRDASSRPVRRVTWHEALAYCRWLNKKLATSSDVQCRVITELLRDGSWAVSLPSELEWEVAARGGLREQLYPWGNEPDDNRANYHDTGLTTTTPVGCFAPNGLGLYDMAGNVAEWTRSLWGNVTNRPTYLYPYVANDREREHLKAGDDMSRIVRGGSYDHLQTGIRCAHRARSNPNERSEEIGFRIVLRRMAASRISAGSDLATTQS